MVCILGRLAVKGHKLSYSALQNTHFFVFPLTAELIRNLCRLLRDSSTRFAIQNVVFSFDRVCLTLCMRDCDPQAVES